MNGIKVKVSLKACNSPSCDSDLGIYRHGNLPKSTALLEISISSRVVDFGNILVLYSTIYEDLSQSDSKNILYSIFLYNACMQDLFSGYIFSII